MTSKVSFLCLFLVAGVALLAHAGEAAPPSAAAAAASADPETSSSSSDEAEHTEVKVNEGRNTLVSLVTRIINSIREIMVPGTQLLTDSASYLEATAYLLGPSSPSGQRSLGGFVVRAAYEAGRIATKIGLEILKELDIALNGKGSRLIGLPIHDILGTTYRILKNICTSMRIKVLRAVQVVTENRLNRVQKTLKNLTEQPKPKQVLPNNSEVHEDKTEAIEADLL